MKKLIYILLLFCFYANAQSDLQKHVQDFNDCTPFKVDNIKQIVYKNNTDAPYKIHLFKQANDWYFTIEVNDNIENERRLVYSILEKLQLENIKLSEVKQTYK